MKHVTIYTDGACSGNPGPGGWAAILIYGKNTKHISGGERYTTNNRMEIKAALKALQLLNQPCEVSVYSDSAYLVNAHKLGWLDKWQSSDWMHGSPKEPVQNIDLWKALLDEEKRHQITWHKVSGHSGDKYNEICDKLAVEAAELYKS